MKNTTRLIFCLAALGTPAAMAQSVEPFSYGPVEVRDGDDRPSGPTSPDERPSQVESSAPSNGFGASRYEPSYRVRANAPDWRVRGPSAKPAAQSYALSRELHVQRDAATGHFIMPVLMNGVRVPVIIDTGASMTFLSPEAARATGASGRTTHSRPMVGIGGATNLSMTRIDRFSILQYFPLLC